MPNLEPKKKHRIQIDVPDYFKELNTEVWSELEEYLFRGFLISNTDFIGKSIIFKTLNHNELSYISMLKPLRSNPLETNNMYRAAFIAYSVFIIDGENVLYNRPKHVRRITDIFTKLDLKYQEKILANLNVINAKAHRLHELVEIYAHENRSRYHWLHTADSIHYSSNTGIAGTEILGMNHGQQAWTVLNKLLDKKESFEQDWNNAKFIGSCFAGKGVRSIDEKDRARKEKEQREIEEKKMKVLHKYLNRKTGQETPEDSEEKIQLPDGRMATVSSRFRAESVEELADQLSAALSGEKDHHDLVIEAHKKKLQERARSMDEMRIKMYQLPAETHLAPGMSSDQISGVLGTKAMADDQVKRLKGMRYQTQLQLTEIDKRRKINEESSDKKDKTGI